MDVESFSPVTFLSVSSVFSGVSSITTPSSVTPFSAVSLNFALSTTVDSAISSPFISALVIVITDSSSFMMITPSVFFASSGVGVTVPSLPIVNVIDSSLMV